MFERILVPLDGTPQSEAALPVALGLAKRLASNLLLMRVSEVKPPLLDTVKREVEVLTTANEYLHQVFTAITDPHYGPSIEPERVKTAVAYGSPIEQLTTLAPFERANLIVMTTHARTGLSRLVLGSVAGGVVHNAGVPVVLVKPAKAETDQSLPERLTHLQPTMADGIAQPRLLVMLDGSVEAEAILAPASQLAEKMGATLYLLRVEEPFVPVEYSTMVASYGFLYGSEVTESDKTRREEAYQYLDEVVAGLQNHNLNCVKVVRVGQPAVEIAKYVAEINPTLLAMATHARGRVSHSLLGSVAEEVLEATRLPTLMVYTGKAETGRAAIAPASAKSDSTVSTL